MNQRQQRARLNTAMRWILQTEDGYVNDPADAGAETKYGISKRQYPTLDIKNLTLEDAREIYRVDYYDAFHCSELPQAVGLSLFDAVVNHRPDSAVRLLQMAIGATADGKIGPQTIAQATHADTSRVVHNMNIERTRFYFDLVTANSSQARFLKGWVSRVFHLTEFIYTKRLIGD